MSLKGLKGIPKHELREMYERACEDFVRKEREKHKDKGSEVYYYRLLCAFKLAVASLDKVNSERDVWGIENFSERKEEFADEYEKSCYEFLSSQRAIWEPHNYKPDKSYLIWAFERAVDKVRKETI
ncbi:MAG: hypothetical protein QXY62_01140 [Candidatus Altiarchaeota archaeon]